MGWGRGLLQIPSALMLCMEWWSWELLVVLAGHTNEVSLAAHAIAINICVLYYVAGWVWRSVGCGTALVLL